VEESAGVKASVEKRCDFLLNLCFQSDCL